MEGYLITAVVVSVVAIYLVFNHVRSHEKSDSEMITRLTKRKKSKK